jgi:succinoglycan biosynthesis protein ExoM
MHHEICVCIATHRRPQQLERLLTSLTQQTRAPSFEVVVVDNDTTRSAEPVVTRFEDRLRVRYLVEPIRGLAQVRNRSVSASNSPFLAIIDDDHCASSGWLAALYRTAIESGAAAVMGRGIPEFESTVPESIRRCGLFEKKAYNIGERVPWYDCATGNCLLRRDDLPDSQFPFRTKFDLTGGEDTDLFRRMIDRGLAIVAAPDAKSISYRPASRANLYWVLRRALRNGGTSVDVDWVSVGRSERLRRTINAGRTGARQGVRAMQLWLLHKDKIRATQRAVGASFELGKILRQLGIRIEEYRHHH